MRVPEVVHAVVAPLPVLRLNFEARDVISQAHVHARGKARDLAHEGEVGVGVPVREWCRGECSGNVL